MFKDLVELFKINKDLIRIKVISSGIWTLIFLAVICLWIKFKG